MNHTNILIELRYWPSNLVPIIISYLSAADKLARLFACSEDLIVKNPDDTSYWAHIRKARHWSADTPLVEVTYHSAWGYSGRERLVSFPNLVECIERSRLGVAVIYGFDTKWMPTGYWGPNWVDRRLKEMLVALN